MWSVYADDDPNRPAEPDENAMPGPAPTTAAGLDPVELVVDGESFVVTRRAGSSGTCDFDWTSHPASYGFTIGMNAKWTPDRAELTEEIRNFLAEIDPRPATCPTDPASGSFSGFPFETARISRRSLDELSRNAPVG